MVKIEQLYKEKRKAVSKQQWKEAAAACNYLGLELLNLGRVSEALECHKEELELCTMQNDRLEIAVAHRKVGECYAAMSDFKPALEHIKSYFDIAVSLGSTMEEQRAWATLGRTYFLKSQFEIENDKLLGSGTLDLAEQSYIKALDLCEKLKSTLNSKDHAEMRTRVLLNLGLVYEQRGNLNQCAESIRHAIYLAKKHNLHEDLNRCQYSLASVYQKRNEFTQALRLLDGAIASSKVLHKNLQCEALFTRSTILISLRDFDAAKSYLKTAYKLHSTIKEDHENTVKYLKVIIGLCKLQEKIKELDSDDFKERKVCLEKIADGLATIEYYKLSIEFYLSTLECMKSMDASCYEMAPIYFSIAQTYLDDGDKEKALEFFRKEFEANAGKPSEQVKTMWKIAEILEERGSFTELEDVHLKALSLAERAKGDKLIFNCLDKLLKIYQDKQMINKASEVQRRLENLNYTVCSDTEEDEDQDPFDDICISELSDMAVSDIEKEMNDASRRKRRTKKFSKINEKGETPLHQACISDNFTMVKRLVESGHPVNARDYCGWTPLHEACNFGFYDIVEYLLQKGANINDRGSTSLCEGLTPLHDAALGGNPDVMQLLISKGASVTALNDEGNSALDMLLNWMQKYGADVDPSTLKLCRAVEEELRIKMSEAGQPAMAADIVMDEIHASNHFPSNEKTNDKRVRSPSPTYSDSEDDIHSSPTPPQFEMSIHDWDDPTQAQSDYQNVMLSLRRSGSSLPAKEKIPANEKTPAVILESDVADEWLIKDTGHVSKSRKKRKKMSRLSVRTSKSISNYLIEKENTPDCENIIMDDISNDSNESRSDVISKTEDETKRKSFCIRVRITDKLILIPVTDDTCTIGWLAEEAAQRYKNLVGNRPHLTLATNDGALLSSYDLVKTIFQNNEEVSSVVERWDETSLEDRYLQICSKRGCSGLKSIQLKICNFEQSSELNLSNSCIPTLHLNLIFNSLSHYKILQHLDISNTPITDANIGAIIACFPSFSTLISLNLSGCCITSKSLKEFADHLIKQDNLQHKLPKLQSLNLSYNMFDNSAVSSICIILELSSLTCLNLSSCNITSLFFINRALANVLQNKHNLQEFQVSNNILGESGVVELLSEVPKMNLRSLDLSHMIYTSMNLGKHMQKFMSASPIHLKELILQGCCLNDNDLSCISKSLVNCLELCVCDLSSNPALSSSALSELLKTAFQNNVLISKLHILDTCKWNTKSLASFVNILKFKILRHIYLDNVPGDLQTMLYDSWKDCWDSKAVFISGLFNELSVN